MDVGRVRSVKQKGDTRLEIETRLNLSEMQIGNSIACSGVCLTVVEKGSDWFAIDFSAETLSKTNLGLWQEGTLINIERSLKASDELGGHLVSGHVDGVGTINIIKKEGDSFRYSFSVPKRLAKFIAIKGSIALNGISLTVNEIEKDVIGVSVIPHTQKVTNLSMAKVGDTVNVEVDLLARYVARILGKS